MNESKPTVNPAGAPVVRQTGATGYQRQDFIRDLKKVSTKGQGKGKPKTS